jgi:hypothetical protein
MVPGPPDVYTFYGEFTNVDLIQDPVDPGHVSNRVINPTMPFTINLEWSINGNLGVVNQVLHSIDPKVWYVYVYFEKMGPGDDIAVPPIVTGSVDTVPTLPATWTHSVEIAANTLPEQAPPGSEGGMYRLCVVVWANTNIPGAHDIVGCHEGPIILAENPA